jgi:serine acetyltransferase
MCTGSVATAGSVILPGTVVPANMRAQGVPARIVEAHAEALAAFAERREPVF